MAPTSVRVETAKDSRYQALVALVDNVDVDDAVRDVARGAVEFVEELDGEAEELEREVERVRDDVDGEISAVEESAEREVEQVRTDANVWREMVAHVLGLGPYDASILTLDDARMKLRGVLDS